MQLRTHQTGGSPVGGFFAVSDLSHVCYANQPVARKFEKAVTVDGGWKDNAAPARRDRFWGAVVARSGDHAKSRRENANDFHYSVFPI